MYIFVCRYHDAKMASFRTLEEKRERESVRERWRNLQKLFMLELKEAKLLIVAVWQKGLVLFSFLQSKSMWKDVCTLFMGHLISLFSRAKIVYVE